MKILCVDTSSKFLSLALAEDGVILSRMHRPLDRKHSTRLVLFIEKILKGAKVSLKNIDGFCISKGPGSFTGLRIGITTVKALAFVLQKPVTAIPTLDILAENMKLAINKRSQAVEESTVCPVVDAKQKKIYTCIYQVKNKRIRRLSEYLLLPIDELLKELRGKVFFLGDGVALYRQRISMEENIQPVFMEEKYWYPQASRAVPLAVERFCQGKTDDVNSLTPLYLYPKECQIRR